MQDQSVESEETLRESGSRGDGGIGNTNTHHLRSYIISDILLKCGVLFISVKVFQNLHVNKLTTPHFLYLVIPVEELGGRKFFYYGE